jgi:hypothetical protein
MTYSEILKKCSEYRLKKRINPSIGFLSKNDYEKLKKQCIKLGMMKYPMLVNGVIFLKSLVSDGDLELI